MRIIYSGGNRPGACEQLTRIVEVLRQEHDVMCCGYMKGTDCDLRTIAKKPGKVAGYHVLPKLRVFGMFHDYNLKVLMTRIKKFKPDLIICDMEPTVSVIANYFNFRTWYCSPLHILKGIRLFGNHRYTYVVQKCNQDLNKLPEPERRLIYSPFGELQSRLSISAGFSWIRPYYKTPEVGEINKNIIYQPRKKMLKYLPDNIKIVDNWERSFTGADTVFITGDTSKVADAMYAKKTIITFPDVSDWEQTLNSRIIQEYSIGYDLGQIEYMEHYAKERIEKALSREYSKDYLIKQDIPFLHEEIHAIFGT